MKIKNAAFWKQVLQKHQTDVGKVRDKLRHDMSEMDGLAESCERAYEDLQHAIDALSELA